MRVGVLTGWGWVWFDEGMEMLEMIVTYILSVDGCNRMNSPDGSGLLHGSDCYMVQVTIISTCECKLK